MRSTSERCLYTIDEVTVSESHMVFVMSGWNGRFCTSLPVETPIDQIPALIQQAVDEFERQRQIGENVRHALGNRTWTAGGCE